MGLFRRKRSGADLVALYSAKVHFYGDVDAIGSDPDELDIRAWVEASEPPDVLPGRNALAALVPLLAPFHLAMNAGASWASIYPTVELLERASSELLKDEESARSYSLDKERIRVGGPPEWPEGTFEETGVPRAVPESEGSSHRIQGFDLMQHPNGNISAYSEAPDSGQAYFANSGLMLLIQHVAREYDYEGTVVPMAVGLQAFDAVFHHTEKEMNDRSGEGMSSNESGWSAYRESLFTLFPEVIASVVFADDPRRAVSGEFDPS